ncbi:NifB/NifX family molybdenum-iron cluster-binding protein [Magnetospirillum fulvum]|uniref:Predicted Fe-Mo cluster-binding protein, NifX family n=1 Tax=Magnetospirillum fulvum TaxID=1082 RepID=A0A1H6HT96_MAGFU|nr:NifB/NifX family molybdenum-iron cluster-binding protein [Magnetospirillum fulvum]SEH37370.1 Predicted Fe-Mo cluster-binding protein, NifX family [Magnetospirillum fulvum]
MKIAVAVDSRFSRISGHAGRARSWLVWECAGGAVSALPSRVVLDPRMVFHHHEDGQPHPLDGVDALLAISAGEGFVTKMMRRGLDVRLTAETDPAKAVSDYLADRLSPPRPRPIGELLCKALDMFSPPHHGGGAKKD